jgi:aspartyl-tRNA(Asn)/glutamyl-tRNA(Gln) amidotransferase subunit A
MVAGKDIVGAETAHVLWRLSASELHQAYRDRSLDPVAVTQAVLDRMDEVNGRINAVISRRDSRVLNEAQSSAQRFGNGQPLSAIDGIPLTVKDSLLTADQPTSWGSKALREYLPGQDEFAVGRARSAGALIVGKTNVPEFALEGYTDNPVYGATGNPWSPSLTPGGSSGGAVAALAAGIAPLAIGQDGGGSIRRPASHAGVVGLKPSLSAWPRHHVLPSLLLDFEVIGPLARTVADARLLFDTLRGPDLVDRSSLAAAEAAAAYPRSKTPKRLLYIERFGSAPLDPQIALSSQLATQVFVDLGHNVETGVLPLDLDFFVEAWPQIGQIGLARMFDAHPDWAEQASPKYQKMAESGRRLPASRLWQIIDHVTQLRRTCAILFERIDGFILPSAAALPWPAIQAFPPSIDGQDVGPRGHAIYTGWVNAAGLPGLALPANPSTDGLPIGIQLVGAYGSDDSLLDLGEAYEAAAPWAHRWPNL